MVTSINLLKNIGRFENFTNTTHLSFSPLTVIYAENARGKSTLSAIMRSLSLNDPKLINERARLGSIASPHIVIETNVTPPAIFQNGTWNRATPEIVVFDDTFVANNVCSGIEVGTTHRQNLHELIVGAQGIALARTLQNEVDRIEIHNRDLREKESAIPVEKRGRLSAEQFCALSRVDGLPRLIGEAEKRLAAAQEADRIATARKFEPLQLPQIDLAALKSVLSTGLAELDVEALRLVQAHIGRLGKEGERWVGQGLQFAANLSSDDRNECPFCAQDLSGSSLLAHYRGYFSEAYNALRQQILAARREFNSAHTGDVPAAFERSVREIIEQRTFWKAFADLPAFEVDTAVLARIWKTAREHVERLLDAKSASPLESVPVSPEVERAIEEHNAHCDRIDDVAEQLLAVNAQLEIVKEQARDANVATLTSDLANLKAVEARYDPAVAPLCDAYLAEKANKIATEKRRDKARETLDQHRQSAFPAYGVAINDFLQRFNASFRVGPIDPVNTRGGSSANYTLLIDGYPVPLTTKDGETSFSNSLSAGDRNTLALAFFFASLQNDPQRAQRIVVIDDPMTSLDEHRTLHTLQEIDLLVRDVSSMVLLSHSKSFLLGAWDKCRQVQKTALRIRREGQGSTLDSWNINDDLITEHDKRHADALSYLRNADPTIERRVAESLRPMLEKFCRVAYPSDFRPGSMLGQFHNKCVQAIGTANEIMDAANAQELRALLDYGNRYHHDTNSAYATENINEGELTDFTNRTLRFIKRP